MEEKKKDAVLTYAKFRICDGGKGNSNQKHRKYKLKFIAAPPEWNSQAANIWPIQQI